MAGLRLPLLETERLRVRELTLADLPSVHRLLDEEFTFVGGEEGPQTLDHRRAWLEWTVASYRQLAELIQPPYGERGMELKESGELVGLCGLVPSLGPFGRLPVFRHREPEGSDITRFWPEVGLYYNVDPRHRRRGYASEAAAALVRFCFEELRLRRVVATTRHDNEASIATMRRLGMTIERNPDDNPPWFQVVGIAEYGASGNDRPVELITEE